jgi:Caspase domain
LLLLALPPRQPRGGPQILFGGVILDTVISWKRLALGALLLGIATATLVPFVSRGTRGVRLIAEAPRAASRRFEPRQSAALFVGVRDFASVVPVSFAVDDAVDLAYAFALQRHVRLVPPSRVVLLLAGRPVKDESRRRLRVLRDAGADVRANADAAGILAALREQTALAGQDGILIVSLATHGFLRDGNGYILGRSSLVGDPATMLSDAEIFETIAKSSAQRSLVFVDACRERLTTGTRSVLAGAMSAAPLMRRLNGTRGQAVFYAAAPGQWAYDDPVGRNGVFTEAVIDGIKCGAPQARNIVTAEKLAGHVERYVKEWIRKHRDPNVGSATQASLDGEARNMALAQCGGSSFGPDRAAPAGTTVRAFSDKEGLLWQRDVGTAVKRAEAVDLDADGWREVVFATHDALFAFDDVGVRLWSVHEPMKLTAFTTGDLRRKHTNQIVALWNAAHAARLAVYDAEGKVLGAFDSDRRLDLVAIVRPTNRHNPKIVATSGNVVLVFDPKKLEKPLWAGRVANRADPIASLDVADADGDGKSDIALTTSGGGKLFVDVNGHVIGSRSGVQFERIRRLR